MAPECLSRLQRRILAWLAANAQRTRGTMAAHYRDLVRALAHDKGDLSYSLANLEAKGLIRIARTAGGKAELAARRLEHHGVDYPRQQRSSSIRWGTRLLAPSSLL
ncbi:MAG: MarR family transcriptional regulator [Candidatus Entotheonellia bacterium]